MIVKLLTEHHLEFLAQQKAALARLSLHMSKSHIVGNHMLRVKYQFKHTYDTGRMCKTIPKPSNRFKYRDILRIY